MATPPFFALPVSFMTALVSLAIVALILRSPAGTPGSRSCFAALFGVFALQALLVGLRFGYGLEAVAPFQRALPFAVGPLAWLGFRALAEPEALRDPAIRWHLAAAAVAIAVCWLAPFAADVGALRPVAINIVDLLIALSFVAYLVLLSRLHRRGPDAFESAALGGVARTRSWLLAAILFLAGMLAIDGVIALDFALFGGRQAETLIGWSSLAVVALLLAAAILYPRFGAPPPDDRAGTVPAAPDEAAADRALVARIEALFAASKLHHDPDLSLGRLARRLGVPARRVSEAVNRAHGQNVSQFVNARRIAEAADLLASGDRPVGEIMQAVGFRTKSNFNREFRRVTGEAPGSYRAGRASRASRAGPP